MAIHLKISIFRTALDKTWRVLPLTAPVKNPSSICSEVISVQPEAEAGFWKYHLYLLAATSEPFLYKLATHSK